MRLPYSAVVIAMILALPSALSAQDPLKAVVHTGAAGEAFPLTRFCTDVLGLLSAKARVAINLEMPDPPADIRVLVVDGGTVEDVLNRIVTEDPRLEWRLNQGMVVVRSRRAWGDTRNDLNQHIPSFNVTDLPFPKAMWEAFEVLRKPQTPPLLAGYGYETGVRGSRDASPKKVTVGLTGATVLDALNAIAAAAGNVSWRLVRDEGNTRPSIRTCDFDGYFRQ